MTNENKIKRYVMVIGSGGTGSYLVEDLINYLDVQKENAKIMLIDGDILEEKNLERQGFMSDELGKMKSDAIATRLQPRLSDKVKLESKVGFVNSGRFAYDILQEDSEVDVNDIEEFILISCVDNQYARLRISYAMHLMDYYFKEELGNKVKVAFIDSGNTEFTGQSILAEIKPTDDLLSEELKDLFKAQIEGKAYKNRVKRAVRTFESVSENYDDSRLKTTFSNYDTDWWLNLSRADHEMSCDDLAESAPQNIIVNMMSSGGILLNLHYFINNICEDITDEHIFTFDASEINFKQEYYKKDYSKYFEELLEWSISVEGESVMFDNVSFVNMG